MEVKKNPNADIGRNSSLYFAIGLALMVFLSYGAINYKVYDKSDLDLGKVNMDLLDEEEVPVTEQIVPPPPLCEKSGIIPSPINITKTTVLYFKIKLRFINTSTIIKIERKE